jgi:RNA-directed DNA polymerase
VIVNERVTLPRPERDELRAILHNCAAHGWRTQVREHSDLRAHLLGRISWAAGVDPVFGAELRRRFDLLDWT